MKEQKILVVDDSPEIISFLLAALEKKDYKVLVATSGKKALQIVKRNPPDLILLDIQIPDINGYETCAEMKKNDETKDIPIIFLSAYTETFDKVKAFKAGAVDYITKPIEIEEILARINTHLTISRLQNDLKKANEQTSDKLIEEQKLTNTLINSLQDTFFVFRPDTGQAVQWNNIFEEITGYTAEEISLLKAPESYYSEEDLAKAGKAVENLLKTGVPFTTELNLITKDRSTVPTEYTASMIRDKAGNPEYIVAIGRDVTERKLAEEKILRSLREKETLLQEIHHRVKNNLQVISALINMQIQYIDDEEVNKHLYDMCSRVDAMGQLHKKLYESEDFANINMFDYLMAIIKQLRIVHNSVLQDVNYKIQINDVYMNLDTAMPCGMLINEIIMNSIKYAFPDKKEGEIGITLYFEDGFFYLKVYDNGIGLPEEVDFYNNCKLGMKLINMLIKQLSGTVSLTRTGGTAYEVVFKPLESERRWKEK